MDELFGLLILSPTFQACILDFRTTYAMFYPVIWKDLGEFTGGTCDLWSRRLYLNTHALDCLGLANMLQTAAHEYRHAWQDTQKIAKGFFDRLEDQIAHTRKIEGDAEAFQLTVAYELRSLGHPEIWDGSVQFMLREYPECTKAFIAAIETDPGSLWNGRAQTAVLLAWQHNRQRSEGYETRKSQMFMVFNRKSRRAKARLRSLTVDDGQIDAKLFRMPYAIIEDGKRVGVRHREHYGRLTQVERARLSRVTLPKSLRSAQLASRG